LTGKSIVSTSRRTYFRFVQIYGGVVVVEKDFAAELLVIS
jgi:hypothetical protein